MSERYAFGEYNGCKGVSCVKKILVCEDEASIRSFVVVNLERAGYTVVQATSGEEALDGYAADPTIELALLDVMLPGIDGFETCRRLRQQSASMGIIMLTARTHELFDSLQCCYPDEYRHHVELIPNRGHSIDYFPTTPWLSQFVRRPHPTHFVWEDFPMDGLYRRGFYNIAVHERDTTGGNDRTRYEMTIEGNTIRLTVERVQYEAVEREPYWGIPVKQVKHYAPVTEGAFTLYLSDDMVDFSKKVTLIVNGKQVYRGKVKPDMRHLVNSCACYFDPERLYAAGIEVRL